MFFTQYGRSWYLSKKVQQCWKSTCTGYSMFTKYILLLTAVVVDALHQVQGCLFLGGGSLIFFSQEGVVCAERDHHKAELPPYFCHPHRKHHRWHHNLTGKGGGVTYHFHIRNITDLKTLKKKIRNPHGHHCSSSSPSESEKLFGVKCLFFCI